MNRSPLMLGVERKIGENIESFLTEAYVNEWKSSLYIGRKLKVHPATIRRWLMKSGVNLRNTKDYLSRRIKKPLNNTLKYYYHVRKPVSEIASERKVCAKTVYRWMESADIERRKGSNAYLDNGFTRPSNKELEVLLSQKNKKEISSIYDINPHTLRRWIQQAGLHQFKKSRYDSKNLRRNMVKDLLERLEKDFSQLRYEDFSTKKEDGNSYRGLLNWYIAHHRCRFSGVKRQMKEDYSENDKMSNSILPSEFS
ncbi:MAG: hypothetical protein AABX83_00220 [Nanoarchaeota archaeon]